MKIGFFGSHDLGIHTLETICREGRRPSLVVGPKIQDPWYQGIDRVAKKQKIPFLLAESGKDEEVYDRIKREKIDIIFLVNYPFLIGGKLLSDPGIKIFNVHASLLPNYRGRAPLNWAMLNGEKEVGVTLHQAVKEVDAGEIFIQRKIFVEDTDYIGDVLQKVKEQYPLILLEMVEKIEQGRLIGKKQEGGSCYRKRTPKDGELGWDWEGETILRYIKALSKPYPGAYFIWEEKELLIWRASFQKTETTVLDCSKKVIFLEDGTVKVILRDGTLSITEYDLVEILEKC